MSVAINQKKINYTTEIIGGITIFAAMSYIVIANPVILSSANIAPGSTLLATCLVAGIGSVIIGIVSKSPSAMACGMGLNSFVVAFSSVWGFKVETLLFLNLLAGLLVFFLSRPQNGDVSLRQKWLTNLPSSIKRIIDASVAGLILTVAVNFVLADQKRVINATSTVVPGTELPSFALLTADGRITPITAVFLAICFMIAVKIICEILIEKLRADDAYFLRYFLTLISSLNMLFSIFLTYWMLGGTLDKDLGVFDNASGGIEFLFYKLDFSGSDLLTHAFHAGIYFFTIMFVLLFDISGSPFQMLPRTVPHWSSRVDNGFQVDSLANVSAALLYTSPVSCYIENLVGKEVGEDGKGVQTGIPAIITGILFLSIAAFAFYDIAATTALLAEIPNACLAPMLLFVVLSIGESFKDIVPSTDSKTSDQPKAEKREILLASIGTFLGTIGLGLAFGLAIGIVLIALFVLLSRHRPIQHVEATMAILAALAILGQATTYAKLAF